MTGCETTPILIYMIHFLARAQRRRKMQRNVDALLGKWLLCRLMLKKGYSETDIANHMK
jgi:hypothetical protein